LLLEERHFPSVREWDFILPIEGLTDVFTIECRTRSFHENLESVGRKAVCFLVARRGVDLTQ
jgi:hypothetical protein